MKTGFDRYHGLLLLGLALIVGGCSTVPVTGRRQLNLISASEETQLGLTSFQKMKGEMPVSKDAKTKALVEKVGRRIAAVADLPGAQWEFVVFDSKEANAFCLPGGKVGVYTGILPITRDEAGLATVIGHEVAHAAARHGAERMTQQMVAQTGGSVVSTSLSSQNPTVQSLAGSVYSLGASLGVLLPYSRKHESEADEIGLIYMARAGYDPEAAVGFWQRFAEFNTRAGPSSTPWWLRTHPMDAQRIDQLKTWLPRARQEFRAQ